LLRYGIPDFKLSKSILDRRLDKLAAEGVLFRTGCTAGVDVTAADLRRGHDAVVLAGGASRPRDLAIPGRDLAGIHFAMDYLSAQNRRLAGQAGHSQRFDARGRRVVIIGGGDTGSDCLGTALRQGAQSVVQLELMPKPPDERPLGNPWPLWPHVFRVSTSHEEGGTRMFAVSACGFTGEQGRVTGVDVDRVDIEPGNRVRVVPDSRMHLEADLVLLAMGFAGVTAGGLLDQLGLALTDRGTVARDADWMTPVPGVFTAGDMQRGASLVVWAIADGRNCAKSVDSFLARRFQT
jgi:glutamate synthase (NADPH/NADH) small chain